MTIDSKQARHRVALILVAVGLSPAVTRAEQADRTKPINIEFDVATLDQNKRVRTLEGNVILTQGTMRFAAERMIVREDDTGAVTAEAFGGPKGQIAFRQKRDGSRVRERDRRHPDLEPADPGWRRDAARAEDRVRARAPRTAGLLLSGPWRSSTDFSAHA